jgi:hypothetical protein
MAVTLQARAGIARSGASRSNFYTHINVVLTIAGTDRSSLIQYGSLRMTEALNDEPDTASFTIVPNTIFTPAAGQEVIISFGSLENRQFGGQIVTITHRRRYNSQTPYLDVRCQDYGGLFDRRSITTEWSSLSATQIAREIVDDWTSGFTRAAIETGLPTIDYFPAVSVQPSALLQRLAALIGGGFYLDAYRDVHVFGSSGESGALAGTNPTTLTNGLVTLKNFSHHYDRSQLRTRVLCEGMRTTCPLAVSAGVRAVLDQGELVFPVERSEGFTTGLGLDDVYVRFGTERFRYSYLSARQTGVGENQPGAVLTDDASPGDTSITVDSVAFLSDQTAAQQTYFLRIGSQVILHNPAPAPPFTITGIPATGFGSISAPISSGATVTTMPSMAMFLPTTLVANHPPGEDVVLYAQADDVAAQGVSSALEGGDGIHEHVVSDGRLDYDGALAKAQAELDTFKSVLLEAEWDTEDLNARVGRSQVINLTTVDALSATLTIIRSEVSFLAPHFRPRRHVSASTVKPARLLDVVRTED